MSYSLRRLLVFFTLTIVAIGFIGMRQASIQEAGRRHKHALAEITKAGGEIEVLARRGALRIDFSQSPLTDAELERLLPAFQDVVGLTELSLSRTRITARSIPTLIHLPDLINVIELIDTDITVADAAPLRQKFFGADIHAGPAGTSTVVPRSESGHGKR